MTNLRQMTETIDVDVPSSSLASSSSCSSSSNLAYSCQPNSDETIELGKDDVETDAGSRREAACSRTSFFVNVDWRMGASLETATTIVGQMYTERLDPVKKLHPYPIVLIHGDFHTGQLTKPDGNPGWASYFVQRGFQVYIVDLPPCGRSNFLTAGHFYHRDFRQSSHTLSAAAIERDLTAQAKNPPFGGPPVPLKHDKAGFHDKWPGTGQRGDPIFANYCASTITLYLRKPERQSVGQNALQALLKRIGKAFLVGEGSGGNMSWLATDVEPSLVAGVLAIEPSGPPFGTACSKTNHPRVYSQFIERDPDTRLYGVTDIPLTYDPPTHDHEGFERPAKEPLDIESVMRPDRLASCFLQKVPDLDLIEVGSDGKPTPRSKHSAEVRQLIHLKKVPQAIMTAHASPHNTYDWATFAFLQQAGVPVEWLRLEDLGILGNGHLMFLETNSDQVAGVIERWILRHEKTKSLGVANPITPDSRNVGFSNKGHTTESEQVSNESSSQKSSSSGSRPKASSDSKKKSNQKQISDTTSSVPNGAKGPEPRPLGTTPQVRAQDQPRLPVLGTQTSAPIRVPETGIKRPFQPSPSPRRPDLKMERFLAQDPKRRRIGENTPEVSVSAQRPPGTHSTPQTNYQQPFRAFQNSQFRSLTSSSPQPISDLNMLRTSHPGGPSQLRQQMELIAQVDRAERQSGRRAVFSMPPRQPSDPGHELYAHLAVDPQLRAQTYTTFRPEGPRFVSPSGIPDCRVAENAIRDFAEGQRARRPDRSAQSPRPAGSMYVHTGRSEMDGGGSQQAQAHLSTPAVPQTALEYNSTPITPIFSSQMSMGNGQQTGFGHLLAGTPPSPSPAPRPQSGQWSRPGSSQPSVGHRPTPN